MSRIYTALHTAHANVHGAGVIHYDGTPVWWSLVALALTHAVRGSES